MASNKENNVGIDIGKLRLYIIADILDSILQDITETEEWVGKDYRDGAWLNEYRGFIEIMDTWGRWVYAIVENHEDYYLVRIIGGDLKLVGKEFEISKEEVERRLRMIL